MKKIHFMVILVIISALLFAACGQDIEKANSKGSNLVVNNITVSVTVDYELNGWDGDILVKLTLSEGEWDKFLLWPDGGSLSNDDMAAEKAAIFKWVTLSFSDTTYNPGLLFVAGGYDYFDYRDDGRNRVDPKALFFRYTHGYMHPAVCISEEQNAENFLRHFPITVTLNEKKLGEMKAKTNITGNLTAGTKTATLDRLYKGESDAKEVDNLLEKYDLSLKAYLWNDYMPPRSSEYSLCSVSFDSATELPPMEVSATIITERITLPDIELYDIYKGNGTYGLLFRKDFRPVNGFRLNDNEEYTIKITVKIFGEKQTVTFENQKVAVTW